MIKTARNGRRPSRAFLYFDCRQLDASFSKNCHYHYLLKSYTFYIQMILHPIPIGGVALIGVTLIPLLSGLLG